jgi:hypothetical protein
MPLSIAGTETNSDPVFSSMSPPVRQHFLRVSLAPCPAPLPASMSVHSFFQSCYASSRSISVFIDRCGAVGHAELIPSNLRITSALLVIRSGFRGRSPGGSRAVAEALRKMVFRPLLLPTRQHRPRHRTCKRIRRTVPVICHHFAVIFLRAHGLARLLI